MVALRAWGLVADRDVALRQLGKTPAIVARAGSRPDRRGMVTEPVPRATKAGYPS